MSELSNYAENALTNAMLRATSYTSPASVFIALHTADPTDVGNVGELSVADNYTRKQITFGAPTDGISTNSSIVSFAASGGDWGLITHFSIWDASSAGNCLMVSPLDNPRTVSDGGNLDFPVGNVSAGLA